MDSDSGTCEKTNRLSSRAENDVNKNIDILVRRGEMRDLDTLVSYNIGIAWESEKLKLDKETVRKGTTKLFSDPSKGFYIIAEDLSNNSAVAGSLLVTFEWSDWRALNYYWIQSVYVSPNYRGRGVYSMMYQKVVNIATEAGSQSVRLYVDHENEVAKRVYEKNGMQKSHYEMYEVDLLQ